ncbi:hypothetical protein J2S49_001259 [Arcanobacterium wilhelmae]|uniref:Acyltransferase 3 domain-containing protein n=1 Tax=Arcanobacterium wilhelmae TaxID=1803177 RepID=A0ABT9NCE9_9ACTO|nr:acyltransferase family protein [Arcanobacterium wilhelmae]MDP9801183.1 hypothetical protein [Arcanobacterium wilhelmae]WFN90535.1 acyltransferase family protein [Arcanobacterium wilhelmae]
MNLFLALIVALTLHGIWNGRRTGVATPTGTATPSNHATPTNQTTTANPAATATHFLSRSQTNAVNGVFIMIVFASHVTAHYPTTPWSDGGMLWLISQLGQLMVACFLLFSGYGMMVSLASKSGYARTIPRARIGATLAQFIPITACYLVLAMIGPEPVSATYAFFAMFGWFSLANASWYIFAILALWALTWVVFRGAERVGVWSPGASPARTWVLVAAFTLVVALFELWMSTQKPNQHYTFYSMLCFPAGMMLALARPAYTRLVVTTPGWLAALTVPLAATYGLSLVDRPHFFVFGMESIAFALTIVSVLARFPLRSRPLEWCGENLFWLYTVQNLPMIVLDRMLGDAGARFTYPVLALVATAALAIVAKRLLAPLGRAVRG